MNIKTMLDSAESLPSFFHDRLKSAFEDSDLEISEHTEFYIIDVLSNINNIKSEYIGFDKPAALIMSEAVEGSPNDKSSTYKDLGDATLVNCSMFREQLRNNSVNIDYYINIGEISYYKFLEFMATDSSTFHIIYNDLSDKLKKITDVVESEFKSEIR